MTVTFLNGSILNYLINAANELVRHTVLLRAQRSALIDLLIDGNSALMPVGGETGFSQARDRATLHTLFGYSSFSTRPTCT